MWEILNFLAISAAENSNKFQKTRFWKEESVEDAVTLGPMAQVTLVQMKLTFWKEFQFRKSNPVPVWFFTNRNQK